MLYLSHSAFIHSNLAFLSFQEGDEVSQKSEEENINIIQEESTKPNNKVNLANSYYSSFLKSGMCIDFSNETFIFFIRQTTFLIETELKLFKNTFLTTYTIKSLEPQKRHFMRKFYIKLLTNFL